MNLSKELKELAEMIEREEENKNTETYLNVNTVMDAITNKQEEVLTFETPYRQFLQSALEEFQDEVKALAKQAVNTVKNTKEKENVVLPSGELVSKDALLEAIERIIERMEYYDKKLQYELEENIKVLEKYLKTRNLDQKYIDEVKQDYLKHGRLTKDMQKDIIHYVEDFLTQNNEREETIHFVNSEISKELAEIAEKLQDFDHPIHKPRHALDSEFLNKFSNIPYIPLGHYGNSSNGLQAFAKDYHIDASFMDHLLQDGINTKDQGYLWKILSTSPSLENVDPSMLADIRIKFEKDFAKKLNSIKNEKHSEIISLDDQEEQKDVIMSPQQAFTNICKTMSFSDQQINELLNSVTTNKGKLEFSDGRSMYRVLKEEILMNQQKKLPKGISKEEEKQAYLDLIKERQNFFQNIYQYRSDIVKGKKEIVLPGKKIVKKEKSKSTLGQHIMAGTIALKDNLLKKIKERYSNKVNYDLSIGDMCTINEKSMQGVEVTIHSISIYDVTTNKHFIDTALGTSFDELMIKYNIDRTHKLTFSCEIADGENLLWVDDPFDKLSIQEVKVLNTNMKNTGVK